MKILFVDDASDTRSLFFVAFKMEGHSTRLAADGVEAVEAVEEEPFDAIIMDIEMPRMNGWDATHRIRQIPNGRDVPIVMFTGYNNDDDRRRALAAGANDLLHKPLLPHILLNRISQLATN